DVGRAGLAHRRGGAGQPAAAARSSGCRGREDLQAGRDPAGGGVMVEGRARTLALFAGSIVVAFALWQFLSTVVFNPFLIPPPLVVFETLLPMARSGEIFRHMAISMARVGVGFVTGCAAGIVVGVMLGPTRLVT